MTELEVYLALILNGRLYEGGRVSRARFEAARAALEKRRGGEEHGDL